MASDDITSEYIEFLRKRGRISHAVTAPPDTALSTLALTQRCLASGIAFPVPLPDGSVGIKIDGDVPPALAALDLVIERVSDGDSLARANGDPGADDGPADNLGDANDPEADRNGPARPQDDPDRTDSVGEVPPEEAEADDPPGASGPVDGAEENTVEQRVSEDACGDISVESCDEAPEEDDTGIAVFLRSTSNLQPQNIAESTGDPDPDEMPEDGDAWAERPEHQGTVHFDAPEQDTAETVHAELAAAPSCDEDASTPAAISEACGDAADNAPDRMRELLDVLSDLEVRIDALATEQSQLSDKFDAFSTALEDVASRPVPRPDATEFNRGMARMTSAFAHAIRRLEETLEATAAEKSRQGGEADLSGALSTGLSAIADAVRASGELASGSKPALQPDLAVIASMQETMSHQLAKLIESRPAAQPPAMEEFLLDLRHATAELLAEQARMTRAG